MQNKNWTTFPNHTFRAPDVQLFPFRQEYEFVSEPHNDFKGSEFREMKDG